MQCLASPSSSSRLPPPVSTTPLSPPSAGPSQPGLAEVALLVLALALALALAPLPPWAAGWVVLGREVLAGLGALGVGTPMLEAERAGGPLGCVAGLGLPIRAAHPLVGDLALFIALVGEGLG